MLIELKDYQAKIIESPAIKFPNNEIFISIIDQDIQQKEVKWFIPGKLINNFRQDQLISQTDNISSLKIEKFNEWLERTIGLKPNTIVSTPSVSYVSKENNKLWGKKVRLNICNEQKVRNTAFAEIYNDSKQIVAAYFNDKEILSMATDNGSGSVTISTSKGNENRGYASECLSRLINEYIKRNKTLGFGTEKSNISALRVAEKCGMELSAYGYWIKLTPEDYLLNKNKIKGLLSKR